MSTEIKHMAEFQKNTQWQRKDFVWFAFPLVGGLLAALTGDYHVLSWIVCSSVLYTLMVSAKIEMWRARVEHLQTLKGWVSFSASVAAHSKQLEDRVKAALDAARGPDAPPPG